MKNNHNEATAGTDAFKSFFQQFGPDDIYTRIIVEVLLEELLLNSRQKEKKENGSKSN